MNPQQLQRELQQALTSESLKPRRVMVVRDAIYRLERYLYRRRLNYRYGVIIQGRRIFIADKRTLSLVNEIGIDIATGATSHRSFVYNIVVLGSDNGSSPQPLELNKGGAHHGTSHQGHTRQRRSPVYTPIR